MGIHGALVGHLGPKVKNFEGFKFDAGSDHVQRWGLNMGNNTVKALDVHWYSFEASDLHSGG